VLIDSYRRTAYTRASVYDVVVHTAVRQGATEVAMQHSVAPVFTASIHFGIATPSISGAKKVAGKAYRAVDCEVIWCVFIKTNSEIIHNKSVFNERLIGLLAIA
jgi:hypothetical protein